MFRLNVFPIHIPPLRERKEDIPSLASYFIDKKAKELKLSVAPSLAAGAINRLVDYDWPGNIREMENLIERALIVCHSEAITFDNLGVSSIKQDGERSGGNGRFPEYNELITSYILQVLDSTNGKIHGPGGAADIMGLNPSTLRSKIKKLGITYKRNTPLK